MKGGFLTHTDLFIPFAHVSITGQRPSSPESTYHLISQGGYR